MTKRKAEPESRKAVKRRKNRDTNDRAAHASLLGLPAELRNTVYVMVLVESGDVHVDRMKRRQPSLLRTCSQIREEASGIFYTENSFKLTVADLWMPPPTHWLIVHTSEISVLYHGRPKWKNFLKWCKYYHATAGEYCHLDMWTQNQAWPEKEQPSAKVAFNMVTEMKDMPWKVVSKVIELYRQGVDEKRGVWSWKK